MTVNVYACGGAGTNIAKQIKNLDINTFYIDTSLSNLRGVSEQHTFVMDDIDGAGKDRSKTYNHIKANRIEDKILIKFKPSNSMNVVLHSLSGGSGSIIAPFIAKKLLENNKNVIVVCVDSRTSVKEIDNSIKTLMTYKSISDQTKSTVPLFFIHNKNRKEADAQAIAFVHLVDILLDKTKTEEFDVTDFTNFLQFQVVSDNQPTVGVIEVSKNEEVIPSKGSHIASSIIVTKTKDFQVYPAIADHLSNCIVTDPSYDQEDMRIDHIVGAYVNIIKSLENQLQEINNQKRMSDISDIEVQANTSDGIVL